ncbi:MAG TPA: hypothetical protein VMZ91_03615 [Candidatus Paceibacterota bacterium]|nr:hypothetical protein [Candidatus Paceibacterota bacterium]
MDKKNLSKKDKEKIAKDMSQHYKNTDEPIKILKKQEKEGKLKRK